MKKLVWLLVLALLVVPAFAAISVTTSASGSLSFFSQLYPTPVTFVPSASLSFNFDLSGDSKTVGNITAVINAVSDQNCGGSFTTSGSLTFKNLGGLVDLSLNRGTLTVSGTNLVSAPLDGADGIGVVVSAPFKVTAGYSPLSSDALSFTQGVLAGRVDGTVGPATVYALVSMSGGSTTFAVGGSVAPVPMVSAFAEYASISPNYIVGATVKPVTGVELYAHYQGDNTYKVSAKVTTIPNVEIYGEYTTKFFGYATVTQSLPLGTLSAGAGYDTGKADFALFAKLSTPVGPATNVFRVYKNYDITDADGDGAYWYDDVAPTDFKVENVLSVSF